MKILMLVAAFSPLGAGFAPCSNVVSPSLPTKVQRNWKQRQPYQITHHRERVRLEMSRRQTGKDFHEDFYRILGVNRRATDEDIKAAYRRLAKQYHPDANSSEDTTEYFQEINRAYEVLKDPSLKKIYDTVGGQGAETSAARREDWASKDTIVDPALLQTIFDIFGGIAAYYVANIFEPTPPGPFLSCYFSCTLLRDRVGKKSNEDTIVDPALLQTIFDIFCGIAAYYVANIFEPTPLGPFLSCYLCCTLLRDRVGKKSNEDTKVVPAWLQTIFDIFGGMAVHFIANIFEPTPPGTPDSVGKKSNEDTKVIPAWPTTRLINEVLGGIAAYCIFKILNPSISPGMFLCLYFSFCVCRSQWHELL